MARCMQVESFLSVLCEETDIAEVELKMGSFKMRVRRSLSGAAAAPAPVLAAPVVPVAAPAPAPVAESPLASASSLDTVDEDESLLEVTANKVSHGGGGAAGPGGGLACRAARGVAERTMQACGCEQQARAGLLEVVNVHCPNLTFTARSRPSRAAWLPTPPDPRPPHPNRWASCAAGATSRASRWARASWCSPATR
jgi:hypothetical protein